MALITCKDCKKQFSTDAKHCPNCGAKPRHTGCFVQGIFIIFVLWALGHFFGGTTNDNNVATTSPTPEQQKENAQEDAMVVRASAGAAILKKAMRNPDSFKLESSVVTNAHAVCYEYRAQNGFGGINVEHAVFASDGKTFKSESMDGFGNLWHKECYKKEGKDYVRQVNELLETIHD